MVISSIQTIDPLCILPVPSPVVSLCFVSKSNEKAVTALSGDDSDTSDSDGEEIEFRSSALNKGPQRERRGFGSLDLFSDRYLISCDQKGEAFLWDLNQQKQVSRLDHDDWDGPGLCVKRTANPHYVMLQTRDPNGTVSIYSWNGNSESSMIRKFETFSQTFCQAAPCKEDQHLFALPSRQDSVVTVVDDRDPVPVATILNPNHGMLTSLAMSIGNSQTEGRYVVACGMESGSIVFHDLSTGGKNFSSSKSEINLGKDPVLSLDMVPSDGVLSSPSDFSSVFAVAGMAGDAAEMNELPSSHQGAVSLVKAKCQSDSNWNVRLRARMATCRIDDNSFGKPGVSICRFRPGDGRLVAVGSWDYRLRLFERSKGDLMAILRGHTGSVNAIDWAPDASESGLVASAGGEDSQIYIWSCYGKNNRS